MSHIYDHCTALYFPSLYFSQKRASNMHWWSIIQVLHKNSGYLFIHDICYKLMISRLVFTTDLTLKL